MEPYSAAAFTTVTRTSSMRKILPSALTTSNRMLRNGIAILGIPEALRRVSKTRPIRNGVTASSKPTIATSNNEIAIAQACGRTYDHKRANCGLLAIIQNVDEL